MSFFSVRCELVFLHPICAVFTHALRIVQIQIAICLEILNYLFCHTVQSFKAYLETLYAIHMCWLLFSVQCCATSEGKWCVIELILSLLKLRKLCSRAAKCLIIKIISATDEPLGATVCITHHSTSGRPVITYWNFNLYIRPVVGKKKFQSENLVCESM